MNCKPAGYSDEENEDDDDFEFSTDYNERNYRHFEKGQDTEETQFYTALRDGDFETMKTMLTNGFLVDQPLSGGWSPLMHASSLASFPAVELLIKSGANVNFNNERFTSLMALCKSSSFNDEELLKCFNLLLKSGANVNSTDKNFCTALMYACTTGHVQLVKAMVDCNCDVNIQDTEGWSALFHTVNAGREDIIYILIEAKARVDLIDRRGRSAFDLAVLKGYENLGRLVCSKKEKRRIEAQDNSIVDNLEKIKDPVSELLSHLPMSNAESYSGYSSDVSVLLWGMGLGHFCKLFVSNKIQLNEFLLLNDKLLKCLGVKFSFHRQLILNSIRKFHLHQWNKASLGLKPRNIQMNVEDGVRLMYNITKHLHIIIATINYTHIHQPLPVRSEVFKMCEKAVHQLTLINGELKAIKSFASQLKYKENIEPVDLIKPKFKQPPRYFVPIVATTVLFCFVLWKKMEIFHPK